MVGANLRRPSSHPLRLRPELFVMLDDRETSPPDTSVIAAGVSTELARAVTAPFVRHEAYGTRCSTVLMLEPSGAMFLAERRFDALGAMSGETTFELAAGKWA